MDNNLLYLIINAVIVVLLIIGFIFGFKKGFIYEIISFGFNFIDIFLSYKLAPILTGYFKLIDISDFDYVKLLNNYFNIDVNSIMNTAIWFIALFIVIKLIFIIVSPLFKAFSKLPIIGFINELLGGIVGILNITLLLVIISMVLKVTPLDTQYLITENTLFYTLNNITNMGLNYLLNSGIIIDFDGTFDEFMSFINSLIGVN